MPAAIAIAAAPNCRYFKNLKLNSRLSSSLCAFARENKDMVTAASSSSGNAGAYTTIKEIVRFEKEIKKSKFIAIAGPVSNEQSAFSFLSQVSFAFRYLPFVPRFPCHLANCYRGVCDFYSSSGFLLFCLLNRN